MQPNRPTQLPPLTLECFDALAQAGCGQFVSIGGAFGLAHYFEYRTTHDVDAWWVEPVTSEQRKRVTTVLEAVLRKHGAVRVREWGDVVSVELRQANKTTFSFQIARRSAQLMDVVTGVWPGQIAIDSFEDLLASKMTALVNRGAPRDFRDVYRLCLSGLCNIEDCWRLWEQRRLAAGEATEDTVSERERARLAICTNLARVSQARPIKTIDDEEERMDAEKLRNWFAKTVCEGVWP
ncbi:MAG: nucleotidyl transferase AbiEii/AbiGii toxin family protein [Anaerolineae bacterium]|nr:nucleotidyl transferase AbiEii/AbiGii toxin family protein [Anaerolineae bacterium]